MYSCSNGGICSTVPAFTSVKVNSAPPGVTVLPALHSRALTSVPPELHVDATTPTPRHA